MKEVEIKTSKDGLQSMYIQKCDRYSKEKYNPFKYVRNICKKLDK